MWEVYKNDVIVPFEDAAGITNTALAGRYRLGGAFPSDGPGVYEELWDGYPDAWDGYPDDWGRLLAPAGTVLSRRLVCDRCGCPFAKAELKKQNGWMICSECLDN